jgi:hypothetical protein
VTAREEQIRERLESGMYALTSVQETAEDVAFLIGVLDAIRNGSPA